MRKTDDLAPEPFVLSRSPSAVRPEPFALSNVEG